MHNDKYYRSKIPLPLILLFLVNLFLVIAVEVLLIYRYPAALTPEALQAYDRTYENCTIMDQDDAGALCCCLIKTTSGEFYMVPLRRHSLVWDRARILTSQITPIPADVDTLNLTIKNGIHSSSVTISREPMPGTGTDTHELYLNITFVGGGGSRAGATLYMVLSALLEGLELSLLHLIKKQ